MFFVVETDRSRLADLAQRLGDGRLKPVVGAVCRWPKRLPRSPRAIAVPARPSSASPRTGSHRQSQNRAHQR